MSVRWGFLGAGRIARDSLAPAVHAADGAVLAAAASRDQARATLLGPHRVHSSYDALVDDPGVDAVYICLPPAAHAAWTVAALTAGKDVLCEKPLALSAAQVDAVTAASVATGRTTVEAAWNRWHPRTRLVDRLLADEAIGVVSHVAAGFTFSTVPAGDFRLNPRLGGGALLDVGCYAVSGVLWGARPDRPEVIAQPDRLEVSARQRIGPTGVDLATDLVLEWDGGEAEVHCAMDEPPAQWLVITGDDGEIELRPSAYAASEATPTQVWLSQGGTRTERLSVPPSNAYRLMVEEVSSALAGGPGWLLPLAQSRRVAAVLDATVASAGDGGRPVVVG